MITYSENRVKTHIRKHLCPGGYVPIFDPYYIEAGSEKLSLDLELLYIEFWKDPNLQ